MGTVSIRQAAPLPESGSCDVSSELEALARTLRQHSASVAQLDRAAGFYPAGSGFESWRGRSSYPSPVTRVPDTASGARVGVVRAGGVFSPERRLLTSGLVLIVTLVAFESMSVATVMPVVESDLGDLALYGWVFSAFFLGTLVGVVIAGTAADRMRPALPFIVGLMIFAVGLVAGGMAPTMIVLVLGRFLQGVGAGAMPATSYVCIGRIYPLEQRPQMFALISSAWMLPSVIGPVIAAWIAETVGWRWVFLGLLPLTAVIGVVAVIGVKSVPAPDEPSGERNVLNAVFVAVGAGLLLIGLGSRSLYVFAPITLIGAVVMVRPFMRLTPVGTLRARAGLPATVAVRGLLNFGFYAADAFVPFAITTVRNVAFVRRTRNDDCIADVDTCILAADSLDPHTRCDHFGRGWSAHYRAGDCWNGDGLDSCHPRLGRSPRLGCGWVRYGTRVVSVGSRCNGSGGQGQRGKGNNCAAIERHTWGCFGNRGRRSACLHCWGLD